MSRKALFFDVDGTLVNDKTKKTPQSAVDAINAARADGHLVFINSGRVACLMKNSDSIIKTDGLVLGCGTQIVIGGKTLMEYRIPRARCNQIKKEILKYKIEAIIEAQQGLYFPNRPFKYEENTERVFEYAESLGCAHLDAMKDNSYSFDKFCIMVDPLFPREDVKGFFNSIKDMEPIDRGRGFYECVPSGYSKGNGIQFVLNHFNIADKDAYVFGDSMNDLSMFTSGVKNCILMGEHDTGLESYATYITKPVDEDGIAYAMYDLGIV